MNNADRQRDAIPTKLWTIEVDSLLNEATRAAFEKL